MNQLDHLVLAATLLAIAGYGLWRTRGRVTLGGYLKGDASIRWGTIAFSVTATQASAITFLSTPGLAYENGVGFVQNYFGTPLALVVVCAAFLPAFQRGGFFTAYEYLGRRFDQKTRLLAASLFLVQRGLATGITLYAPAIVISALVGWNLNLTILLSGALVVVYTAAGGTKAVSLTQQYQLSVILLGMALALVLVVRGLPPGVGLGRAVAVAGELGKLRAVDLSFDPTRRYTLWSGLVGGFFLALSYFGTDQSQVQRYLAGDSLTAGRLGLLGNALVKVPMQFGILFLGAMLFVSYQFERPPLFFNQPAVAAAAAAGYAQPLAALDRRHEEAFRAKEAAVRALAAIPDGADADADAPERAGARAQARAEARRAEAEIAGLRAEVRAILRRADPRAETTDSDYVFITYVLAHFPHGFIGLLVAVIFCAAFSAAAGGLNALAGTTAVDYYRPFVRPGASDAHYVRATRVLTLLWGAAAVGVALAARLVENLLEAANILGSLFYGQILGIFVVALFVPRVRRGTVVFAAALAAQALVLALFLLRSGIGYLWYNPIGCAAVVGGAWLLEALWPDPRRGGAAAPLAPGPA